MKNPDEHLIVFRVENPRSHGYSFHMLRDSAYEIAVKRAVAQGVSVTVWCHTFKRSAIYAHTLANLGNGYTPGPGREVFVAEPPLMPPTSAAAAPGREAEQSH